MAGSRQEHDRPLRRVCLESLDDLEHRRDAARVLGAGGQRRDDGDRVVVGLDDDRLLGERGVGADRQREVAEGAERVDEVRERDREQHYHLGRRGHQFKNGSRGTNQEKS